MPSLNVNITSDEKGALYNLEITNTQPDETRNIGSYAATLSGVGLEPPLTIKLRKFDRGLGAVKLTSRVLGRLFRKHTDKLATSPARPSGKTRTPLARKEKEKKEPRETAKKSAPAPVAATAPAPPPPPPAPAPEPSPAAPVAMAAYQV
jgi:hypothetical protein